LLRYDEKMKFTIIMIVIPFKILIIIFSIVYPGEFFPGTHYTANLKGFKTLKAHEHICFENLNPSAVVCKKSRNMLPGETVLIDIHSCGHNSDWLQPVPIGQTHQKVSGEAYGNKGRPCLYSR
jgi:hypothetical protein